jgi:hypothetical protein
VYRRDLRDTDCDGHVGDMAVADRVVQAAVAPDGRIAYARNRELTTDLWLAVHGDDASHELRRYEWEPHGFGKRGNVLNAYTRVADLFAKYLRKLPDDGSSRPYEPPASS